MPFSPSTKLINTYIPRCRPFAKMVDTKSIINRFNTLQLHYNIGKNLDNQNKPTQNDSEGSHTNANILPYMMALAISLISNA